MTQTPKSRLKQPDGLMLFEVLESYVKTVAQGQMKRGQLYSLCVRASLAKCYEFDLLAWDESRAENAFFWLPTLRGICEEIIVLNYAQNIPGKERDLLFSKLMLHDVHVRLATQEAFFSVARPLQPILRPNKSQAEIESLEEEIRSVWRAYGWPNMSRGVIPPIRQIAEKHGGDILAKLYDYLYRLTSNTVHFSVGALLRTGWGDQPKYTFSVKHLNKYYTTFGRIYGAFLFCVYFELFSRFLQPGKKVQAQVGDIRKSILSVVRWPEMVTFEEMNIPVPDPGIIIRALSVVVSSEAKRLLAR